MPTQIETVVFETIHPPRHTSPQPADAEAIARAFAVPSAAIPTSTRSPINACLTEEQFELVQSLIRHKSNIPLVAVAGVMDGLLGREGAGEGSGSIAQSDVHPEADNPSDYDYDFV